MLSLLPVTVTSLRSRQGSRSDRDHTPSDSLTVLRKFHWTRLSWHHSERDEGKRADHIQHYACRVEHTAVANDMYLLSKGLDCHPTLKMNERSNGRGGVRPLAIRHTTQQQEEGC